MKLELIRRSERSDYVCYGVTLKEGSSKGKLFKIYIPSYYNTGRFPPERMIVFTSIKSTDDTKHLCHTCGKEYPKHQYKKHEKKFHTGTLQSKKQKG
jgi:hypothetical protein